MKYLIVPILLALSACAATSQPQQVVGPTGEIVPVIATEAVVVPVRGDLFADAHRCQGVVKYQAEIQNDKIRSRLSCEWEVEPDQWDHWDQ